MKELDSINATEIHLTDVTRSCFLSIKAAIGFDVPDSVKMKFKIVKVKADSLNRLTIEGGSDRDWLTKFKGSIENVNDGLAASYYHLSNVEKLEQKVISIAFEELPIIKSPKGCCIAMDNSEKLGFEYIAFLSALRRTLEYLSVSVGAFFKQETHKFSSLAKSIKEREPKGISIQIDKKLQEHVTNLSDIYSESHGWAPRDIITHKKPVSPWLNIIFSPDGDLKVGFCKESLEVRPGHKSLILDSEGPEIAPKSENLIEKGERKIGVVSITPILKNQIKRVEDLIFDLYKEMGLI